MPDSWGRIIGYLDFSQPDMSEAEILLNAPHYSYVFGAQPDQVQLRAFRAANPTMNIGRYFPAFLDEQYFRPTGPDEYGWDPTRDTPERRARTILWWNTEVDGTGHPDWVLYRCDGMTPAYWSIPHQGGDTLPNVPLDISNPGVADWQLRNNANESFSLLYSSVFMDMVYLENHSGACGIWRNGQWVQLFTGAVVDPAYAAAAVGWASRIYAGLHSRPTPQGFVVNCPLFMSYPRDAISALLQNVDGLLDEEGFNWYGEGRLPGVEDYWLNKVTNMVMVQDLGLAYYSMNYVKASPPAQEDLEWILGSFLLGKGHSAYMLITFNPPLGDFGVRWPHLRQYEENFGHPCAPMTFTGNVYLRDYSRGLAVVNPFSNRRTVQLPPGSFRDLNGVPVSDTLVLEPVSGKVLLSTADRCG